jgi:hypothetical protein
MQDSTLNLVDFPVILIQIPGTAGSKTGKQMEGMEII